MTDYPVVQFVSDVGSVDALFDCSTDPAVVNSLTVGVPEYQGDPEAVGTTPLSRPVSFTVTIGGPQAVARAAMARLSRCVLNPQALYIKQTPSAPPFWMRLYGNEQPGELSDQYVQWSADEHVWQITANLAAEPFFYGVQDSQSYTVQNTPVAGAGNRCLVTLPAISGDAPALVDVQVVSTAGMPGLSVSAASVPVGTGYTTPVVVASGSFGSAVSTTRTPNALSTTGYFRNTTMTGTTTGTAYQQAHTCTVNLPATGPGRYRVLCRVKAAASGFFRFQLHTSTNINTGTDVVSDAVSFDPPSQVQWQDCGEVVLPVGGESTLTSDTVSLVRLYVSSGASGPLTLDESLLFIPTDGEDSDFSRLRTTAPGPPSSNGLGGPTTVLVESSKRRLLGVASGAPVPPPAKLGGGFPHAYPGRENSLLILLGEGIKDVNAGSDSLATQYQATVSWRPRYLYWSSE